jgi:hypothetical protein
LDAEAETVRPYSFPASLLYLMLIDDDLSRNLDMIQATGWNSLERTEPDWCRLFASVDSRYQFLGTRTPEGSAVSLLEAVFKL